MNPQILSLIKEGRQFAQQDDWQRAQARWEKAIALSGFDVEVLFAAASLLSGGGKIAEAKKFIQKAAESDAAKAAAFAAQTGLDRWEQLQDAIGAVQLSGLSLQIAGKDGNVEQLAFTSGNLANILSAAGSLEASLIHYSNAANYYRQIGDMEWAAMMTSSEGAILTDLQRYPEAKEKHDQAIKIAAENGKAAAVLFALLNLGSLYGGLNLFEESKAIHREALRIAWENRLVEEVGKSAGRLALDLRNLGLSGLEEATQLKNKAFQAYQEKAYDWAIFGLKYAASLIDAKMEPIELAEFYHALSDIEFSAHQTEEAAVHLQESRKLARAANQKDKLAAYAAGLSRLFLAQGKLTEAADACDEAIAAAGGDGTEESLLAALGNRGIVALRRDELTLAESLFLRQYKRSKKTGLQKHASNAANSLGAVNEKMGAFQAAEKWFELGIEESEDYKWPAGLNSLVNIAILQNRRGEIEKAISSYLDALALAIRNDNFDQLFDVALNLGMLYAQNEQVDKARPYLEQAAEWNKELKAPNKGALIDMNEGFLLKSEGKGKEALKKFQDAFYFFKTTDWKKAAKCALEAAALLMELGRLEESLQQVLPAVQLFEQRMDKLADYDAWRIHREEEQCFQLFTELTWRASDPKLALLAAERSRGRAFRLALRRQEAGHRTRAFDNMQILRQAALEGILSGKAKGAKKEYVDQFIRVLGGGARDPKELTISESWIRQKAKELDLTFIVYAKGYSDQLYAWVINGEKIEAIVIDLSALGGLSHLKQLIKTLRKRLGIPDRGARSARHKKTKDPDDILIQLYTLLIDPLSGFLPKEEEKRLCFVPWGPLFEIPFCALLDKEGRYLVDRYASFVVPSLYFFASRKEKAGKEALVIGDPIPTSKSHFGKLPRLPYSAEEARRVAELYQTKALLGLEADKEKVLERIASATTVHFAAHGLLDESYPLRSAIALSATEKDAGLLYAADLKKLSLKSQLVVLSACSSALGNITGDGVLGLCREFLTAGADAVLASIWAVGDRSSSVHMTYFHQNLQKMPAVEALRAAQLATRAQFEGVSHWAAFVLWGWGTNENERIK